LEVFLQIGLQGAAPPGAQLVPPGKTIWGLLAPPPMTVRTKLLFELFIAVQEKEDPVPPLLVSMQE
jgi:hypothetical protein